MTTQPYDLKADYYGPPNSRGVRLRYQTPIRSPLSNVIVNSKERGVTLMTLTDKRKRVIVLREEENVED